MSALVSPRHVIVINCIAMQETVEEEEVLRRLGTREEAGLTEAEAARRLRLHGPNVVVRSQHVRQPPQSIPPPPQLLLFHSLLWESAIPVSVLLN